VVAVNIPKISSGPILVAASAAAAATDQEGRPANEHQRPAALSCRGPCRFLRPHPESVLRCSRCCCCRKSASARCSRGPLAVVLDYVLGREGRFSLRIRAMGPPPLTRNNRFRPARRRRHCGRRAAGRQSVRVGVRDAGAGRHGSGAWSTTWRGRLSRAPHGGSGSITTSRRARPMPSTASMVDAYATRETS